MISAVPFAKKTGLFLALAASMLAAACSRNGTLAPTRTTNTEQIRRLCLQAAAEGYVLAPARDVGVRHGGQTSGSAVIIYGASWCKACGATEKYLAQRGVPYVEMDVERDPSARESLAAMLADAGLPPTSALPVVDVRGTVMTGFYPCVFEVAWAAPRRATVELSSH